MNRTIITLLTLIASIQYSSAVRADTLRYYNAWSCQGPDTASAVSSAGAGGSGLEWGDNISHTFYCPAVDYENASNTISSVFVYYKNQATTNVLACTWYGWDGAGNFYSSATKYSCTTAGGCTSSGGAQDTNYSDSIKWTSTSSGGTLITGAGVTAPLFGVECTGGSGSVEEFDSPTIFGYATDTTN